MLDIFNGRKAFFQWDSGQKLTVSHAGICEVHFHHPGHDSALVVKIYELEGQRVADVPNILLQDAGEIIAYIYLCIGDECTVFRKKFEVIPRQKPADYVYTETETKTYKALEDRIKALEMGGASDADIMAAIEKYMQDHPVQIEEKDPSVPSWAKEPTPPKYTAQDVGALPADTPIPEPYTLPPATKETLGGMMPGNGLIVDADGRVSVEPDGEYELIETITLEEDMVLERSQEPNGKPYNFTAVEIKAESMGKAATLNPANMWYLSKGERVANIYYSSITSIQKRYRQEQVIIVRGFWTSEFIDWNSNASAAYNNKGYYNTHLKHNKKDYPTIDGIRSSAAIPAGKYEIWGVRANA